jgi:hypothetical protein
MAIRTVNVQNYERAYPSTSVFNKVKEIAGATLSGTMYDLSEIRVFNMNAKRKRYNAGTRDNFCVFLNATPNERNTDATPRSVTAHPTMFGIEVAHGTRLASFTNDEAQTLVTPEGEELGVYIASKHELYIYHDFQQYPTPKLIQLLTETFKFIREQVLDKKGQENSWVHSTNKEAILKKFNDRITRQQQQALSSDKDRLAEFQQKVERYQRDLKSGYDNISRLMTSITAIESGNTDVQEKLVQEMNNIADHPRITDLRIEGDFVTVTIPNIVATDKHDRQFYIGNFQVKINMSNSEVRFFGDNPRQSYWTEKDPHPHVSGNTNNACLGNVAGTIAELCSQNEIYALVMTAIDFLENANIDDGAGKNVVKWEQVGEKGKKPTAKAKAHCDHHDGETEQTMHRVATEVDEDGDPTSYQNWCDECRVNDATDSDTFGLVADDILNELENY